MIAQTIQLALAPVFVLVAIGHIMNTLSSRLGRVVDRSRYLQGRYAETTGPEHESVVLELRLTARRILLIGRSLTLLVISGLIIGLTVGLLFLEEFGGIELQPVVAGTFFVAIALLMGALWVFLTETRTAAAALNIPADYLEPNAAPPN